MKTIQAARRALTEKLLPEGIPELWCPLLTHYTDDGTIDLDRMSAHFMHIVPWIKGYLIPGSTGDAWDLDERETDAVADFGIRMAHEHGARVLLGVLKADTKTMEKTIRAMVESLERLTGINEIIPSLAAAHVCGFTVCPPRGKTLGQDTILRDLSKILDTDVPVALYQLPQVTENETAPETFALLVEKYANLIFFKDSSGDDHIALSEHDKGGVYLVRGAEGDYAQWKKESGGPYDGFLLSTANCFPSQLLDIITQVKRGDLQSAQRISAAVSGAVAEAFKLVSTVPAGNAFTNANKAFDHYFAFGPSASRKEGPMLHGKIRLPDHVISKTGEVLSRYGLMPGKGYLE